MGTRQFDASRSYIVAAWKHRIVPYRQKPGEATSVAENPRRHSIRAGPRSGGHDHVRRPGELSGTARGLDASREPLAVAAQLPSSGPFPVADGPPLHWDR